MTRFLLLQVFSLCLFAQAPHLLQGPFLGASTITRSSASIAWATDLPATTRIKWGTSPVSLLNVSAPISTVDLLIQVHSWYTYGTPANTTIYYQACSTANSLETCSSTQSYTSAAQSTVPADPAPPAPVDTPVTPAGTTWTVGSNCDDPATGLVAMWTAAARGDIVEIDPAVTPYCAGRYIFPAKPPGPPYILTRVKNASTLFPNNRRANLSDKPQMARFIHSSPNIDMEGGADPGALSCYAGGWRWRQYQNNSWAMYRCNNTNAKPINSITGTGNIQLTVPNHGYPGVYASAAAGTLTGLTFNGATNTGTAVFSYSPVLAVGSSFVVAGSGGIDGGFNVLTASGNTITFFGVAPTGNYLQANTTLESSYWGFVTGVTGPGASAVNRAWKLRVIGPNTIELHDYIDYPGPPQATGASAGGTVYINQFQLEPVTEAATPPGTCTFGTWWHEIATSGSDDEYHRTWYCDAPNELIQLRMDPNYVNPTYPVIDILTNRLDHLMFQGLSFEPMHQKADPQRLQYQASVTLSATGITYWSFVGQSIYNDHIYWDNILAGAPDPSLTGEMERLDAFALDMSGTHIHIGGSYFYGFQLFHSLPDLSDDSAVVIVPYQGGPFEMINNYLQCAGICLYASDDLVSMTDVHDWTIRRNTISNPDKYWKPSSSMVKQGFYFSSRHRSERKHMHREWDDGNIFTGGWVWNNNAAGICLCTRSSSSYLLVQSVSDTMVQGSEPGPTFHGYTFSDVQVGDLVTFTVAPNGAGCSALPGKIYTVTAVTDLTHISIASTGCTGTGGGIARLLARTSNINDVLITNHTWLSNPTDFVWLGHDSYPNNIGAILHRVKLRNNLSVELDGTRVGQGAFYSNPSVAPAGSHLNLGEGGEDLQVDHETTIGRVESTWLAMDYGNGGASQASGLKITNNILEYLAYGSAWSDGVAYGKTMLDREWTDLGGTSPDYSLARNVILRKGGCGGNSQYPEDPCAGPPWGPYPSGVLWFDTNSGPFPFLDPRTTIVAPGVAVGNYRIKSGAAYTSGGALRATDGSDIGVNMDVLEAAQGKVSNVRAFDVSSTAATVGFLAPDTVGCPVDWSTNNFSTFSRVQNAGGARVQNVQLTGLPPQSKVAYRVDCVVMQPGGTFLTR